MKIIGITGTLGAGKGAAVEFFKTQGFAHYSARAFIVKEIEKRGLPVNRDTMTEVANDIRKTYGPGHIIQSLYHEARADGRNAVIESIRTLGELATLENDPHFLLIAIGADPKLRYQRIKKRASETDHVSYEQFLEDEAREMSATDPTKQNIRAVMQKADIVIHNNNDLEHFHRALESALRALD
jgi:dephospho-CoA kinase